MYGGGYQQNNYQQQQQQPFFNQQQQPMMNGAPFNQQQAPMNSNSGMPVMPNQQQQQQQQPPLQPNMQFPMNSSIVPQQPFAGPNGAAFTAAQQSYSASSSSSFVSSSANNQAAYQQQQYQQQQQQYQYEQQNHQQQMFKYQEHQQQQAYQQQQVLNPNLPPGSSVITNQVFYADSHKSQQHVVNNGTPPVAYQQQVVPQPIVYQQPVVQPAITYHASPMTPSSHSSQAPPSSDFDPSRYQKAEPIIVAPTSPTTTNILSHTDSSLMVQEVFLQAGQLHPESGQPNAIDLQGIWALLKPSVSSSGAEREMRLSFRMKNQMQGVTVSNMEVSFLPNNFGLTVDPSLNLMPNPLGFQQSNTSAARLFCCPENQRISSDSDIASMTMRIRYRNSNLHQPLEFYVTTLVPLHIFFHDQPQTEEPFNPNRSSSENYQYACSEDGPRLTQTKFLSLWKTDWNNSDLSRNFAVSHVGWRKWFKLFGESGVLSAIRAGRAPTAQPTPREAIQVFEHKLSMNRIYVVASREVASGSVVPDLVFFVSFKVGEGQGSLVLGEIRVLAGQQWDQAEITLKSTVNARMWAGLERAVRAVLIS